ncbi:MAG: hypothetical protein SO001_08385, partial [Alloprevotella sp.]|nr:hypothetical protein [Alloprevotella sp.]
KNIQNHLSCVALRLALSAKSQTRKSYAFRFVLSPLRLRSVPARPHRTSKKQEKVDILFFCKSKEELHYFFLFFACGV